MQNRPKNIAIIFVGNDAESTGKHENLLSQLREEFDIEIWRRCDKFSGIYSSYSQIINEAVCDTASEYMFFVNPKVSNISPDDIKEMLSELLSGYCWTSRVAFGLFGTTKELFRKIGLMDERFIGSEYEDDDFFLRLKMLDKAIIWRYNSEMYPDHIKGSPLSPMRGCSATVFSMKWIRNDEHPNLYLLNLDFSEEKKISPSILKNNKPEISNSWMSYDKSIIEMNSHVAIVRSQAIVGRDNRKSKTIRSHARIILDASVDSLRIDFICEEKTEIHAVICEANEGKEFVIGRRRTIGNNMYDVDSLYDVDSIEIKIFHEGEKIYHNRLVRPPFNQEINIGLRITHKV